MKHRPFIKHLRRLGLEKIVVRHNPPTDRYVYNAMAALPRALQEGEVIGWRPVVSPFKESVEMVIWTEPLEDDGCGLYVGCRLHYDEDLLAKSASIFCFYDGSAKSPCYKNRKSAVSAMNGWATKNGVNYTEPEND